MSGRERLRRGWLRFGKVGYKPNKDGKNRLCLEKNRCREEEEFPVVKGISKRVIVVKSPDPKIFEQAIFIIREDFAGQSGVSEKDVLREARAAANSYLGGGKRTTGKLFARLRAPLYAARQDLPALNDARLNLYNPSLSRLNAPGGLRATAYGETLRAAGVEFEILATPGHTPGGVCLYARAEGALFSGDTLFRAGYGRVDFPGSNPQQMRASLQKLFALPGDTRVYPGHGEETTIARERARYGL